MSTTTLSKSSTSSKISKVFCCHTHCKFHLFSFSLVLIVQRAVLKVSENPFVHSKNQTCCMSEIFSPFLGVGDIYEDNSSSSYDLPSISQESKSRTIYNYSDDEDSMISVSVLQNNTE